jgi:predicted phosphodiesterase
MKEIFISDIHYPHHDAAGVKVMLKAVQGRNPDIVHIGGDGVDFHSISRHPKQMIEKTILKYEVEESRKEIALIRKAAPGAQINFQEGNHDARMQLYIRDRAPELDGLIELTFPVLMKLPDLGIRWIPDSEKFRIGKLYHHHGHKLAGGGANPARAKFMKTFQNLIFGHHHRFDYFSTRQYGTNTLFQSAANGNLYTLEPEYAHHTDWNIGFTEVNYNRNGEFAISQVHVNRDGDTAYAMIDGAEYESHPEEDIFKFLSANAKRIARRK